MKKILIFSVTAGNGHNACAKSIKNKLELLEGNQVEVKIVDTLSTYSTNMKDWTADKGYNIAVSKFLPFYHYFFKRCKNRSLYKPYLRWRGNTQSVALSCVGGILKEILDFKPDVVFCTHFYPAIAITDLKLIYNLPCKVVLTSLDYENSPFWESAVGVDYFSLPHQDFIDENLVAGFKKEQLLTLGIPVDERTLQNISKIDARKTLGIKEDVFTAMVMFGGGFWKGGFKIFNNLVKTLKGRKAQIIMINGRNEKDFKRIEKMTFPEGIDIVNVGFTKDVPLYMAASDIILNKCGGLCSTEMINVGRPMVITEKIPTQELYNLEFLKSKGVAYSFKNKKGLAKAVNLLYSNPELRKEIEGSFNHLRKNGCENLAKFILTFDNVDYTDICKTCQDLDGDVKYSNAQNKNIRKKIKKEMKKQDKKSIKAARLAKRNK